MIEIITEEPEELKGKIKPGELILEIAVDPESADKAGFEKLYIYGDDFHNMMSLQTGSMLNKRVEKIYEKFSFMLSAAALASHIFMPESCGVFPQVSIVMADEARKFSQQCSNRVAFFNGKTADLIKRITARPNA